MYLLLIQVEIASPQPHIKMLIRRENLPLPLLPSSLLLLLPCLPHNLTRNSLQPRLTHRMAKERNAIPTPLEPLTTGHHLLATRAGGDGDTVDRALEEAVGPVREHVADVDEDGGRRVVLGAGGLDGDGCPGRGGSEDLEACLAAEAEEELRLLGLLTFAGISAGA